MTAHLALLALAAPACDGTTSRALGTSPQTAIGVGGGTETKASVEPGKDIAPPAARVAAVHSLKRRLGASDVGSPGGMAPEFTPLYDPTGAVSGLWSYREGGLGVTVVAKEGAAPTREELDAAFRAFVSTNADLYDLSAGDASQMGWLVGPELAQYVSPAGKRVQKLQYRQVVDGVGLVGEGVTAVFTDGALVSVNGTLENPEVVRTARRPRLTVDLAEDAAAAHNRNRGFSGYSVAGTELLWDRSRGKFVYKVHAAPVRPFAGVTQTVDGDTGAILHESSDLVGAVGPNTSLPEVSKQYLVDQPYGTDGHPFFFHDVTQNWVGLGDTVGGISVAYHADKGNGGFTHPTFGYYWTGGTGYNPSPGVNDSANKTYYTDAFNFNTAYSPGATSLFASHHTVRWVQHAAQVAARTTFKSLYSTGKANQVLSVVVGIPGGSSYTYQDCSNKFGLSGDCVAIAPSTQPFVGRGDVTALGPMFHEYGHVASERMHNGDGRGNHGCEQQSLEETTAEMYSMFTFMWTYGINTTLTDYNAHGTVPNPAATGFIHGFGVAAQNPTVHMDNNVNLQCYDTRNNACNTAPAPYNFGMALVQGYWESAHGVNCGSGGACVTLNDGSTNDHAGNALAYAMWATPLDQNFVTFVANFLQYYWDHVGQTAWNNRWWIFNHHRLVGPNYGYSPCHGW
jgi:hypothetical protein